LLQPTSNYIAYNRELHVTQPETFTPRISEVFRALPKINRFNGQTNRPYSVASHSLMCEKAAHECYGITKPHLRLAVLLHDASEAYVGDIVRPIKHFFTGFSELENELLKQLFVALRFSQAEIREIFAPNFQQSLHEIDTRIACNEADNLTLVKILPEVTRLPYKFFDRTFKWQVVEYHFVLKYTLLMNERKNNENRNVA